MKQLLTFLKATLLGGVIFVLPAWLAVLLVAKALTQLQVLVKPISAHLPESVRHPGILAVILLVALCLVVGLIIQTAIGAQVKRVIEQRVLEKLPGYTTIRGFAAQLSEFENTANFQPALIEIEDALVPGFFVEQHTTKLAQLAKGNLPLRR
jgi:uncharacterized membrane protein